MTVEHEMILGALQPVRVEDWILFAGGGGHWIRDLDLAERADLEKARDIRTTIKGAIEDRAVTICDNSAGTAGAVVTYGHDGAGDAVTTPVGGPGPLVRVHQVLTPKGNGAMQQVTEFYLNEEAALVVVMRLRTPTAVQLTRAVVRVFLAVARGELPAPVCTLTASDVREIVRAEMAATMRAAVQAMVDENVHTIVEAVVQANVSATVQRAIEAERSRASSTVQRLTEADRARASNPTSEAQAGSTYSERLLAEPDPRPLVRVEAAEMDRVIQETIDVIKADRELFVHKGKVVRIINGRIVPVKKATMRERLTRAARFAKLNPRTDRWELVPTPSIVLHYVMLAAATWAPPIPGAMS